MTLTTAFVLEQVGDQVLRNGRALVLQVSAGASVRDKQLGCVNATTEGSVVQGAPVVQSKEKRSCIEEVSDCSLRAKVFKRR